MKTVRVIILVNFFESLKINNNHKGLLLDIWGQIKKKLDKKYKIIETFKYSLDYETVIKDIKNKKYDFAVGGFFITLSRNKDINFTIPVLFTKPVIVYDPIDIKTNQIKYIGYLFKVWRFPVLLLLCLIIIFYCLFLIVNLSKNRFDSMYYSIALFLGKTSVSTNSNIKNANVFLVSFVSLLLAYFSAVYIGAITTARSVSYFERSNKLENSIEGERILVERGDKSSELIIENKGIPVYYEKKKKNKNINPFKYYKENKDTLKISGVLYSGFSKVTQEAKKYNLKKSQLVLGSYRVAFPVNKKEIKLLKDLNIIIQELDDNMSLYEICKIWGEEKYLLC